MYCRRRGVLFRRRAWWFTRSSGSRGRGQGSASHLILESTRAILSQLHQTGSRILVSESRLFGAPKPGEEETWKKEKGEHLWVESKRTRLHAFPWSPPSPCVEFHWESHCLKCGYCVARWRLPVPVGKTADYGMARRPLEILTWVPPLMMVATQFT